MTHDLGHHMHFLVIYCPLSAYRLLEYETGIPYHTVKGAPTFLLFSNTEEGYPGHNCAHNPFLGSLG